jgi:hemerythrin-like domain-containing protein
MITYDQLNTESDKITQLSRILNRLIDDREILDMEITCDIFYQYISSVKAHLDTVDRNLYAPLLSNGTQSTNNVAKNFLSGSQEIRKIIKSYSKTWCNKNQESIKVKNHNQFISDTRELFQLVLRRITLETEELYPLVRKIRGDLKIAA